MGIFDLMREHGHEQLIFCSDPEAGLRALIGIHDTTLGPALGGCRMWNYDDEGEAVLDALRLSAGMTAKSAVSGCTYGGGKSVIWGDPKTDKTEELFRSFGRFVESLRGRFITGTDVGTTYDDFVWAAQETRWLVALPEWYGGSGDSSLITAFGVWKGMRACAEAVWGSPELAGKTVAIQGAGKVGTHLVEHLHSEGCRLIVADIDAERVERLAQRFGVEAVAPEDIYDVECDIFAPCALGGILNDDTIPRLRCRIVAGSANNQLADLRHADLLHERNILYAPDYVINAGGLIQVVDELQGFNKDRAYRKAAGIADALRRIFLLSAERGITPLAAAEELVRMRIDRLGRQKRFHLTTHREGGR